ncbi:hypothetical protein B0H17DRAFT_1181719 [Mycena rosella]|uniref:F-box domain-containing protein n=1 Tax=Mycena rosella TaxID=1033263 RepID=A0AAD7D7X1_MYCRO|nr:hypothetical protein B0H17DRAFT_1181719 [Mycena rosella]
MATLDSVPPELLIKIFKSTLPTPTTREEALEMDKKPVPLFDQEPWGLVRVCGRWRAVVLNTPGMWAVLSMSIPAHKAPGPWVTYPIALLKEHISRAGQHPLRITLLSDELPGFTTKTIFRTIVDSCARWETLDLVSECSLPMHSLLRMRNNIPLLREVNICAHCEESYLGQNIFEFAPSLQLVRITGSGTRSNASRHKAYNQGRILSGGSSFLWPDWREPKLELDAIFPWAQLTHYESDFTHPCHFDALCRAEKLVVCQATVAVLNRDVDWSPRSQLVHFMHLRTLKLDLWPGSLLDCLVLPALQELFIGVNPTHFHHVVALVRRSQCSLRKFWIRAEPDHPAHYREILAANPDIVELGLMGCDNVDSIIRALRIDAPDLLVPHLVTFYINEKVGIDMIAVLEMVKGRIGSGLRRLCIMAWLRGFPEDARARLWELEEMGLQVQFTAEDEQMDGFGASRLSEHL